MERYRDFYGAREPSDELKLRYMHVESLMMRDREQWAFSEHESTLNSRNRQAHLTGEKSEGGGGGRRASAMAATIQ
eukprot:850001-Pyramimonas_sp.AAC.1